MKDTTHSTSIEKSMETKKKVQNVIGHLISKENVLMITQDAKVKDERFLTLNINVEIENVPGHLEGSK